LAGSMGSHSHNILVKRSLVTVKQEAHRAVTSASDLSSRKTAWIPCWHRYQRRHRSLCNCR
jgi:hypothetical protein